MVPLRSFAVPAISFAAAPGHAPHFSPSVLVYTCSSGLSHFVLPRSAVNFPARPAFCAPPAGQSLCRAHNLPRGAAAPSQSLDAFSHPHPRFARRRSTCRPSPRHGRGRGLRVRVVAAAKGVARRPGAVRFAGCGVEGRLCCPRGPAACFFRALSSHPSPRAALLQHRAGEGAHRRTPVHDRMLFYRPFFPAILFLAAGSQPCQPTASFLGSSRGRDRSGGAIGFQQHLGTILPAVLHIPPQPPLSFALSMLPPARRRSLSLPVSFCPPGSGARAGTHCEAAHSA